MNPLAPTSNAIGMNFLDISVSTYRMLCLKYIGHCRDLGKIRFEDIAKFAGPGIFATAQERRLTC